MSRPATSASGQGRPRGDAEMAARSVGISLTLPMAVDYVGCAG
jgi:hypothetical protein